MPFPPTNWTQLAGATLNGDAEGRRALDAMCAAYRAPVVAFLAARGLRNDELEDVVQDFFLKLLASRLWKRAQRERGKFRTFLLSILNNLMKQGVRDDHRQKRGGGVLPDSFDALLDDGHEFVDDSGAGAGEFDREWALTLVADAVVTVEREFAGRGQQREFELLRRFLPGAALTPSYDEAAVEMGLSMTALRAAVHRLRQRFREVLRSAVARTVSAPHEVDEELRYLGTLLIGGQVRPQQGGKNGKDERE